MFVVFILRWWYLNQDMIPFIKENEVDNILNNMASSYSGYNDMYIHTSAYTLFFLLLLNLFFPDWEIHALIPMFALTFMYYVMMGAIFIFLPSQNSAVCRGSRPLLINY